MKILQVASGDFFSTYGGGQVYVKNIVDEMIGRRMDVCVLSFVDHHDGVAEKDYKGIRLYELGTGKDGDIERVITTLHPDVIHAHSHKALVCSVGERLGIPVVVTAHHGGIVCPAGTLLDCHDAICHRQVEVGNCIQCCLRNIRTGLHWYPMMRLLPEKAYVGLGRWLSTKPFVPFITPIGGVANGISHKMREWDTIAAKCTLMIAPSRVMGEAMTSRGLPADKLVVVPHGIPMPDFQPQVPDVAHGPLRFFYVGRICYVKGLHVLLEAFHQLKESQVEMHLIGGASRKEERRYMAALQKRYAQDPRIIWHGKVRPEEVYDNVKNFHASSSSSSYLESFGLNIAESLAMGKPVLATRCGGAEMQIEEGVNGWLVPTNDVAAMREKMEDIIAHKERIPGMAAQCRQSVVTLQEHCEELNKIYKEVLQ